MNQYIEALNKYVEQKELYGGGDKGGIFNGCAV